MSKLEEKPYWSTTYRIGTLRIYAWERLERGGRIFIKFSDPTRSGRDRRVKEKLPGDLGVRDARGRLDKRMLRDVDAAVQTFAAEFLLGQRPRAKKEARPASLAEGFAAALDIGSGKYPTKTRRWEEVKRAQAKLERLLGRNTALIDIASADVRRVWRTLAKEFRSAAPGDRPCGARQAEVTVDALYSVASWLREEGRLPADALLPMSKWRAKLKDEWRQITGEEVAPHRLRHTRDEMRRLFRAMHGPDVDPRFALAFDLGGEQRIGQVLRCRRSHLVLPVVDGDALDALEPGELGLVRIPSSGHKLASPVVLTADQRRAVEAALAGYLADYEAEWRAGSIADYYLFPAGRFKRGKAKVVAEPKPLTRDAALGMFHELERLAEVAPVKGRGWYGVRRVATDIAEDVEHDERVLNSITGHRDSTTRRLVYQDHERPELLKQAALTRAKVRRGPTGGLAAESTPQLVVEQRTA